VQEVEIKKNNKRIRKKSWNLLVKTYLMKLFVTGIGINMFKPTEPHPQSFSGIRTFMHLPYKKITKGIDFAVIGIPFDTGASYRVGARFGPEAIRSISVLLRPHNQFFDISIFDYCSGVDYGDLPVVPGYIEDSYQKIETSLIPIIENGVIPLVLGGDHSITLPELRAISQKNDAVALIHFDSHSDTWSDFFNKPYSHGTTFRRAIEEELILVNNSIQVGMRGSLFSKKDMNMAQSLGLDLISTSTGRDIGIRNIIKRIKKRVGSKKVFISFDIDFVDPAFAPGTGTIEVGGFTSSETLQLIRGLKGLNIIGCDIVEVIPEYDSNQITAFLAANIIYEFMTLIAIKKKEEMKKN
jgi:agmatinase